MIRNWYNQIPYPALKTKREITKYINWRQFTKGTRGQHNIRHEALRKIPLSGHIADCSDKEPKYFMFPFYQMKIESIIKRKEKEKFFIRTFLPKLNAL